MTSPAATFGALLVALATAGVCAILARSLSDKTVARIKTPQDGFVEAFRNLLTQNGKVWFANGPAVAVDKRAVEGVGELFRRGGFGIVFIGGEIYVVYSKELSEYLRRFEQENRDD